MSTRTYTEQSEVYNLQQNIDARNPFHVEGKGNPICLQYICQF
jgi:hypothetical protein